MALSRTKDFAELYELHDKVTIGVVTNGGRLTSGESGYIIEKSPEGYKVVVGIDLQDALMNQFNLDLFSWYADHELLLAAKEEVQLEFDFKETS